MNYWGLRHAFVLPLASLTNLLVKLVANRLLSAYLPKAIKRITQTYTEHRPSRTYTDSHDKSNANVKIKTVLGVGP